MREPTALLIAGVQASGKSTVGQRLVHRLSPAAFIEGDDLWRMVVSGREDMSAEPTEGALTQLELRYRHGALLSESFVSNGIFAVHADNIYGPAVLGQLERLRCPKGLVVLRPSPEVVVAREAERGTGAYAHWRRDGETLLEAVRQFDAWLAETPPLGLWVDSSHQSPDQTVDWILEHWERALV